MGTIGAILPYINAFVMVLKELIKMFAVFVGYKESFTGLDDLFEVDEGVSAGTGAIADNIGSANKNAKELKKTLMGFDVLNVITTPTPSTRGSGGAGGGGGLGIDSKILGALKDYDSLMDSVRMKATDIRDRIMDWLGFQKKINPLTGEIEWQLRDGLTNFEKILDVVKAIGIAFATWKISKAIGNLVSTLFGIDKAGMMTIATGITLAITGAFLQYKGISHLVDGNVDIFTVLETMIGTAGMGLGIFSIIHQLNKFGVFNLTTKGQIRLSAGILLAITGLVIGKVAIEKENFALTILSGLLTGAGTRLALTMLGVAPTITIPVAVVVAIGSFVFQNLEIGAKRIQELKDEVDKLSDSLNKTITNYENASNSIKDNANTRLVEIQAIERTRDRLSEIVDENGKIKKGYEDRADFLLGQLNSALGTEYKRNGEIIGNYQQMKTEIGNIIEERKKQIKLEAYADLYKESLKEQIELEKQQKELQEKRNELLTEGQRIASEEWWNVVAMDKWNKAWKENEEAINKANKAVEDGKKQIGFYEQTYEDLANGVSTSSDEIITDVTKMSGVSVDMIKKMKEQAQTDIDGFISKLNELDDEHKASLLAQVTDLDTYSPQIETAWLNLSVNSKDNFVNGIKDVDEITQGKILATITATTGLTPTMETAWKNLAQKSENGYKQGLALLPQDTQGQITKAVGTVNSNQNNMYNAGSNLTTELNKGAHSKTVDMTDTVTINENSLKNKVTGWGNSIKNWLKNAIGSIPLSANFSGGGGGGAGSGSIGARAGGGVIRTGEIVTARENGMPELIGRIGNTSAVMNNGQIVEAVSKGVAQAVSSVLGSSRGSEDINIYFDGKQITDVVMDRINRNNNIVGA